MSQSPTARSDKPQQQDEPQPPFPEQHQLNPGLEAKIDPKPRWRAPRYKPAGKLHGKVALITGGDSGIGRAVAYLYAREGADVAINYLPEEQQDAEEIRAAIRQEGRECLLVPGDLRSADFCAELVRKVIGKFGRIDILVTNAAWQNRKPDIAELSEEELDRTLKTNVYAYLRLAREVVPHMKPGSAIVATGSEVGLEGSPQLPDYGATKGAVHAITMSLAKALLNKGIRVNCVAPGPVWTPLNVSDQGVEGKDVAKFGKDLGSSPLERPAQPEEVAPSYVFFASDADSSYITGAVLPVKAGPA
ncbi:MAG TPA: SDR family oxidoreductase [Lacipirellulaceae bacterium]|nr:SDR family oxidoreductase [Lacipirellulaceae bacterium]